MKRWIVSFLLVTSAGMYNTNAQTKTLTLQECLRYAVNNNQRLAVSRLEEEIGRQKTAEVRAQALPQVNANGNLTDNLKKQVLVLPGELTGEPGKTTLVEAGTTWNASASAELNQQLFNQSVFTGLKAAKSGEEYYALQT